MVKKENSASVDFGVERMVLWMCNRDASESNVGKRVFLPYSCECEDSGKVQLRRVQIVIEITIWSESNELWVPLVTVHVSWRLYYGLLHVLLYAAFNR